MSVLITVVFEIPIFYLNKTFKERIAPVNMIFIAMFCYVTRVYVYTLAENPWVILLVEPLHGITYAFLQMSLVGIMSAVVLEGKERVKPHSVAQGVLSMFKDVGRFTGTLVGSFVLGDKNFGPIVLYRGMSVVVIASACVLYGVFRCVKTNEEEEKNQILLPRVKPNELDASTKPLQHDDNEEEETTV